MKPEQERLSEQARELRKLLGRVNSAGFIDWAMDDRGEAKSDWIIARYQARILIAFVDSLARQLTEAKRENAELRADIRCDHAWHAEQAGGQPCCCDICASGAGGSEEAGGG